LKHWLQWFKKKSEILPALPWLRGKTITLRRSAPHEKTQQVTADRKALNVGKAFPENLGLDRKY
jgi:hypothetical protein